MQSTVRNMMWKGMNNGRCADVFVSLFLGVRMHSDTDRDRVYSRQHRIELPIHEILNYLSALFLRNLCL